MYLLKMWADSSNTTGPASCSKHSKTRKNIEWTLGHVEKEGKKSVFRLNCNASNENQRLCDYNLSIRPS